MIERTIVWSLGTLIAAGQLATMLSHVAYVAAITTAVGVIGLAAFAFWLFMGSVHSAAQRRLLACAAIASDEEERAVMLDQIIEDAIRGNRGAATPMAAANAMVAALQRHPRFQEINAEGFDGTEEWVLVAGN